MYINIKSLPEGEAPVWVREKWIGLKLPIKGKNPKKSFYTNVLDKSSIFSKFYKSIFFIYPRKKFYLVPVKTALELLNQVDKSAADWWYENAPHIINDYSNFGFNIECADLIEK